MILLAITPGLGFNREPWRKVLRSGVDGLLIREKHLPVRTLLEAVRWCQDTAPEVSLWVASRLDVALAAGCGLHAPEASPDIPPGLVPQSRPFHDESQWEARKTVNQLLVAPIFDSPGKGAPWGPERLLRFLEGHPASGPRILALGGVDPSNAARIQHPRLDGFAAIRPFWEQDPAMAVAQFRQS